MDTINIYVKLHSEARVVDIFSNESYEETALNI